MEFKDIKYLIPISLTEKSGYVSPQCKKCNDCGMSYTVPVGFMFYEWVTVENKKRNCNCVESTLAIHKFILPN